LEGRQVDADRQEVGDVNVTEKARRMPGFFRDLDDSYIAAFLGAAAVEIAAAAIVTRRRAIS
jgi:hypothetical protein